MPALGGADPVAAVTTPEESYKQIANPEEFKRPPNSNMVKVDGENSPDGAGEKMLSEDDRKLADVKFIKDGKNGDTKVDILEMKQAFVGLTKEELMKYANDPFWVRLRWFMFVLFWALWLGMLVGAVYIIVEAPKCAPPPPKTWHEEGPIIDLDQENSREAAQAFALHKSRLADLKSFKGVVVPHPSVSSVPSGSSYDTPDAAVMESFKEFADEAKANNIRLIMDLTPNHVAKIHDWFVKSELKDPLYKDYFIWQNGTVSDGGDPVRPNNWVSTLNESAWTLSDVRKQWYLHQFKSETPDLNFNNPEVVKEFEKVIQFWVKNGVSGIRLKGAKHLLINPSFKDEERSNVAGSIGLGHTDYLYYMHTETTYQNGVKNLLAKWAEEVKRLTDGQGFLSISEEAPTSEQGKLIMESQKFTMDLSHISAAKDKSPAQKLKEYIESVFDNFGSESWPIWQHKDMKSEESSEFQALMSLLPGVPLFTLNQAVKTDDNTTQVDPGLVTLISFRKLPSILYGTYNGTLLSNNTVFGYTRLKSGNPGFAVLYNPSDSSVRADASSMHKMPGELTVHYLSRNAGSDAALKSKVSSRDIPVASKSVMVLTYVQESEN